MLWAWSYPWSFFVMPQSGSDGVDGIPIHGLAICRYEESGAIYRFSCDRNWETQNDTPYDSIEDAQGSPSLQYDVLKVEWHRQEPDGVRNHAREDSAVLPANYATDDAIRCLIQEGRELEAIARLRQGKGYGLLEAKTYVERVKERL